METLLETRVVETPAVKATSHSDVISQACRDMLEKWTSGLLEVEKTKSWTEAEEQLSACRCASCTAYWKSCQDANRAPPALSVLETLCGGSSRDRRTEKIRERRVDLIGKASQQGAAGVWLGVVVRIYAWSVDHGLGEPCGVLASGPASSSLRLVKAIKDLSWDEAGYSRSLDEWTGISMHQNERAVCLTLAGVAVAVLVSVMVGQTGTIRRGCAQTCRALLGGCQPLLAV